MSEGKALEGERAGSLRRVPAREKGACPVYPCGMKQIWTGRMSQVAGKYGENAPMAAVCCNACRTCVTTNVLGVLGAGIAGAGYALVRAARRGFAKAP